MGGASGRRLGLPAGRFLPGPVAGGRASAIAVLFAALASLALISCGAKLPEVAAVEWRIESRLGPGDARYESLSAFASIKDEDGIGNIAEVWIVEDEAALAWKLTGADWTKSSDGSGDWIGGASLAMPDLGPLPRGKYRYVAIDASGQQAELGFAVSGDFPDTRAPSVRCSPGSIAVSSGWDETLVLAFDSAGALLRAAPAPRGGSSLAEVFGEGAAGRAALVCAYGYDPGTKMGAFSKRIRIR